MWLSTLFMNKKAKKLAKLTPPSGRFRIDFTPVRLGLNAKLLNKEGHLSRL